MVPGQIPIFRDMHVVINTSRRTNKASIEVTYQFALIRRTFREDVKSGTRP